MNQLPASDEAPWVLSAADSQRFKEQTNDQHDFTKLSEAMHREPTNQEIFDIVAIGLRKQGKASLIQPIDPTTRKLENEICAYRGKNGTKCATGQLIRDDEYDPKMEQNDVAYLIKAKKLPERLLNIDPHFAIELQNAHDYYLRDGMPDFIERMYQIADDHGLQTTALTVSLETVYRCHRRGRRLPRQRCVAMNASHTKEEAVLLMSGRGPT